MGSIKKQVYTCGEYKKQVYSCGEYKKQVYSCGEYKKADRMNPSEVSFFAGNPVWYL